MVEERCLVLDGLECRVVISDEPRALREGASEGKALIGVYRTGAKDHGMLPARFAVEGLGHIDGAFVERAARRHYGLPWTIAMTGRLAIRELTVGDAAYLRELRRISDQPAFQDEEALAAYIHNQYPFYGLGMWGLERREDGKLIGIAGVDRPDAPDGGWLELGYGLFEQWRRQGYAREACEAVLRCVGDEWPDEAVFARTGGDNLPSLRLLGRLGFCPVDGPPAGFKGGLNQTDSVGTRRWFRYAWNLT